MPGPAILYCIAGPIFLMSLYNHFGWKAPFRISSTHKGEPVLPGIFYIVEDIVAVNSGGGRPQGRHVCKIQSQSSVPEDDERLVLVLVDSWIDYGFGHHGCGGHKPCPRASLLWNRMGCSFPMGWDMGRHNSTLGTISNEEGEGELGS